MTSTQILLGNILKKRINEQLVKLEEQRDFTSIQESMDILLAAGKLTPEQYNELENLMM